MQYLSKTLKYKLDEMGNFMLKIYIQEKYWEYFKSTKWNENRATRPQYSILETVLIANPNFNDLDKLSKQIQEKLVLVTDEIVQDIETSKLN